MAKTTEKEQKKEPYAFDREAMHKVHIFTSRDPIDKDNGPITAWLPASFTLASQSDWDTPFDSDSLNSPTGRILAMFGSSLKVQALSAQVWRGSAPLAINLMLTLYAETDPVKDVIEPAKRLMQLTLPTKAASGFLVAPGPNFLRYLNESGDATKSMRAFAGAARSITDSTARNLAPAERQETPLPEDASLTDRIVEGVDSIGESIVDGSQQALASTVGGVGSAAAWTIETLATMTEYALNYAERWAEAGEKIDIFIGRLVHLKNMVVQSCSCTFHTQALHHSGLPMRCDIDMQVRSYTVLMKDDLTEAFLTDKKDKMVLFGSDKEVDTRLMFAEEEAEEAKAKGMIMTMRDNLFGIK